MFCTSKYFEKKMDTYKHETILCLKLVSLDQYNSCQLLVPMSPSVGFAPKQPIIMAATPVVAP